MSFIGIQWKSSRFLFPVSTVPARNAWEPDLLDLLCPKYEEKRLADYDPGCYATSSNDATIKIDASKISVDASHRFQPSTEVEDKVGQPHQPNTVFFAQKNMKKPDQSNQS